MSLAQRLAAIQPILAASEPRPFIVPFRGWAPDRADLGNDGMVEALNVVPLKDGFGPLADLGSAKSSALTARCQGAFYALDTAGTVYIQSEEHTS